MDAGEPAWHRPGRGQKRDSTELEDNGDTVKIKVVRVVGQGDGAAEETGDWSDESGVTSDHVEYESTGDAVNTDAEVGDGLESCTFSMISDVQRTASHIGSTESLPQEASALPSFSRHRQQVGGRQAQSRSHRV